MNFKTNFLGLALAGLILGSCSQMGTYENADLTNEQAVAAKAGFTMTPFGMGNENARAYAGADCEVDCIVPGSGDYFVKTGTKTGAAGPNNKSVTYRAYNTETDFVVEVDFRITSGNAKTKSEITIIIDGNEKVISDVPSGGTATHSIPLPNGWMACDLVEFSIRETGLSMPITWSETYTLFAVCPTETDSDCVEAFSYVDNGDDAPYTFKYTPSEDMTDVLVEFTFAQGVVVTGLDGFTQNGGGNSSVWSATLSFEACTEYTFTVDLSADCSGKSGNSNVSV
jgi:hypothetical protein